MHTTHDRRARGFLGIEEMSDIAEANTVLDMHSVLLGKTTLGDGSQILGNITTQNCTLAGGGSHEEANPDK